MDEHTWPKVFSNDGYIVMEGLLLPEECDALKEASYKLTETLQDKCKVIFSTTKQMQLKETYFLDSNDKMVPFYEEHSLDDQGNLKVESRYSLNKIGHALHYQHPLFRYFTYSGRVIKCVNMLGFREPAVVQSMVIFKNPLIGSEVKPHQDATYIHTTPIPPVGFWIALDDATVDNGCLWIIPGSHKSGLHRRLITNPNPRSKEKLIYDKLPKGYASTAFKPIPVKKGTCIILHGLVVHKSEVNLTSTPRPAYTFHIIEKKDNIYSSDNWLQEGPAAPFANMFTVNRNIFPDSVNISINHPKSHNSQPGQPGPSTSQIPKESPSNYPRHVIYQHGPSTTNKIPLAYPHRPPAIDYSRPPPFYCQGQYTRQPTPLTQNSGSSAYYLESQERNYAGYSVPPPAYPDCYWHGPVSNPVQPSSYVESPRPESYKQEPKIRLSRPLTYPPGHGTYERDLLSSQLRSWTSPPKPESYGPRDARPLTWPPGLGQDLLCNQPRPWSYPPVTEFYMQQPQSYSTPFTNLPGLLMPSSQIRPSIYQPGPRQFQPMSYRTSTSEEELSSSLHELSFSKPDN